MMPTGAAKQSIRGQPSRFGAIRRSVLFGIGDCLFLIGVGIVSTLVMHGAHRFISNFALAFVVGMASAMIAQMVMAYGFAPLLGSIESMVPSMVVGMCVPMIVCVLHMFGHESDHLMAMVTGTLGGVAMFVFVEAYGAQVRRRLDRRYPTRGVSHA